MADDVQELYQDMIVDHSQCPRNCRSLSQPSASAKGYNPLCGDKVQVFLQMTGDQIEDVSFQGAGCAISTASASLMTESIRGRSQKEARDLIERFHDLLTGDGDADAESHLGKLRVFRGVRNYPSRVKCAVLAWHAIRAALNGHRDQTVSTE